MKYKDIDTARDRRILVVDAYRKIAVPVVVIGHPIPGMAEVIRLDGLGTGRPFPVWDRELHA